MSRICFLRTGAAPLFLPNSPGEFGGAEVRAFTFARELTERGRKVDFAVAPHAELPQISRDGIGIVQLPAKTRGLKKFVGSIRGRWNSIPQSFPGMSHIDADIVACFGVHHPSAQVIAAARSVGKKTILFLTSSEDVSTTEVQSSKAKRRRIEHNYAIQHADQVVVQTEAQRTNLEQVYRRTGTLIRNPIDTQIDEDALLHFRSHVLWVGRADRDSKRADLCFELARRCPDVPFRVVINGGDDTFLRELLDAELANVQVDTCVPFEDIDKLYCTASVLLNTSVSEGFPNAFLQAMKYRTPILSLDVDPDGVILRHDCGDVAGSMDRMVELLDNYWPRSPYSVAKGKNAHSYVSSHHELSARVDELEELLERVANGNSAAA